MCPPTTTTVATTTPPLPSSPLPIPQSWIRLFSFLLLLSVSFPWCIFPMLLCFSYTRPVQSVELCVSQMTFPEALYSPYKSRSASDTEQVSTALSRLIWISKQEVQLSVIPTQFRCLLIRDAFNRKCYYCSAQYLCLPVFHLQMRRLKSTKVWNNKGKINLFLCLTKYHVMKTCCLSFCMGTKFCQSV